MKSIIKALESIGQKTSIKQFNSLSDMQTQMGIDNSILSAIESRQEEYVCHQNTPDEDQK